MTISNRQLGNVGNLGDLLKHGALVSLLDLLLERHQRVVWVDTHAFLLEAPCPAPHAWRSDAAREAVSHPGLRRYIALERNLADSARYRCSSGLVIDAVRGASREPPVLILGEANAATRALLEEQLTHEGSRPYALLSDARLLGTIAPPLRADALLALVDPFVLEDSLWADVRVGLAGLAAPVEDAIVEAFTFDRGRDHVTWPEAPEGLVGPVAVLDRRPFHLAVYATRSIAEVAALCCVALGWHVPTVVGQEQ